MKRSQIRKSPRGDYSFHINGVELAEMFKVYRDGIEGWRIRTGAVVNFSDPGNMTVYNFEGALHAVYFALQAEGVDLDWLHAQFEVARRS